MTSWCSDLSSSSKRPFCSLKSRCCESTLTAQQPSSLSPQPVRLLVVGHCKSNPCGLGHSFHSFKTHLAPLGLSHMCILPTSVRGTTMDWGRFKQWAKVSRISSCLPPGLRFIHDATRALRAKQLWFDALSNAKRA